MVACNVSRDFQLNCFLPKRLSARKHHGLNIRLSGQSCQELDIHHHLSKIEKLAYVSAGRIEQMHPKTRNLTFTRLTRSPSSSKSQVCGRHAVEDAWTEKANFICACSLRTKLQ